ncbi:conserved protein of unknown function [Ruminococcaceae bacterium BL-6]|nr:conserved protein of unknown function [Ruminococcaceae bacterium BL-6]
MNIIDYIPTGSASAISRRALCTVTGLPDRLMRREIERARKDYAILNIDGSGYFRPAPSEAYLIERWLRQEYNREKSIKRSARGAEKALCGADSKVIQVCAYVRRKRRREDERPQVEGQMKL